MSPSGTVVTHHRGRDGERLPRNTAAGTGVARWSQRKSGHCCPCRPRPRGLIATRCPAPATTDSDIQGAALAHGAADSPSNRRWDRRPRGERSAPSSWTKTRFMMRRDPYAGPLSLGRLIVAGWWPAATIVGARSSDIETGRIRWLSTPTGRSHPLSPTHARGLRIRTSTWRGRTVRSPVGRYTPRGCGDRSPTGSGSSVEADLGLVCRNWHTRRGAGSPAFHKGRVR